MSVNKFFLLKILLKKRKLI